MPHTFVFACSDDPLANARRGVVAASILLQPSTHEWAVVCAIKPQTRIRALSSSLLPISQRAVHPSSPNQHTLPHPTMLPFLPRSSSSFCAIILSLFRASTRFLTTVSFSLKAAISSHLSPSVGRTLSLFLFPLQTVTSTLVVQNPFNFLPPFFHGLLLYQHSSFDAVFTPNQRTPSTNPFTVPFFHDWRLLDEYPPSSHIVEPFYAFATPGRFFLCFSCYLLVPLNLSLSLYQYSTILLRYHRIHRQNSNLFSLPLPASR